MHTEINKSNKMRNKNNITKFEERVYQLCSKVPKGYITSYKEIAHAMGNKAYRAVGTALHNNPFAPKVPCHRVVNSDGRLGGFASGLRRKIAILNKEGILVEKGKIKDFERKLFRIG